MRLRENVEAMPENTDQIEWYIAREGHQHGPLSQDELDKFIEFGHLKPTDLLWRAGFPEWQLASDVFQGPPPDEAGEALPAASTPATSTPADANRGGPQETDAQRGDTAPGAPARESRQQDDPRPASTAQPTAGAAPSVDADAMPKPKSFADAWEQAEQEQKAARYDAQAAPRPANEQMSSMGSAPRGPAPVEGPQPYRDGGAPGTPRQDEYDDDDYDYADEGGQSNWLAVAATVLILGLIGAGGWFAYNNQDEIAALYSDVMSARQTNTDDITIVRAPETASRSAVGGRETQEKTGSIETLKPDPMPTAASISPPRPITADDEKLDSVPILKSKAWAFAEREFPTWTSKHTESARATAANGGTPQAINSQLVNAFVAFRRDNAALALLASPQSLEAVAIAFVDNLKALTARGGQGCYAFISSGEATEQLAPVYFEPSIEEKIDAQMLAIMSAIVEAKSKPLARSPPKAEDFEQLSSALNKRGWSDADLKLFSDPDALSRAKPDVVCRLVTEWFSAQTKLADQDARDRLIAASLRPVIGG